MYVSIMLYRNVIVTMSGANTDLLPFSVNGNYFSFRLVYRKRFSIFIDYFFQ